MEIIDKKILIYGLGISGGATYSFLIECGTIPYVFDDNGDVLTTFVRSKGGILYDPTLEIDFDFIVTSPTVRKNSSTLLSLSSKGAKIMSEIEFAALFCKGKIIGVTGTNGKTTVVTLLSHILNKCGFTSYPCGNIGIPFISIASKIKENEYAVLELSSYQLLNIEELHIDYSILINIHGDHLDYHKSIEEYRLSKLKILSLAKTTIINEDDEYISQNNLLATYSVSAEHAVNAGVYIEGDMITFKTDKNELFPIFEKKDIAKMHGVFLENCLMAVCVAKILGGQNIKILEAIESYNFEKYRLCLSGTVGDKNFYNDSKSTNIHSTLGAIKTVSSSCALILGGRDKGVSYDELLTKMGDNVKYILICGENERLIREACNRCSFYNYYRFDNLEDTVEFASSVRGINNVLFSPSAASFDKYNGYDERGEHYDKIIQNLAKKG